MVNNDPDEIQVEVGVGEKLSQRFEVRIQLEFDVEKQRLLQTILLPQSLYTSLTSFIAIRKKQLIS